MTTRANRSRKAGSFIGFVALVFIFITILTITTITSFDTPAFAEEPFFDYTKIATESAFLEMVADVNSGNCSAQSKYVLTDDIEISSGTTVPSIGATKNTKFQGVFDGNGHKITNYTTSGSGLFGHIDSATVCNLRVEGEVAADEAGGLIGKAYDDVTVYNCAFVGDVTGGASAGFVKATNTDTVIVNCFYEGSVTGLYSVGFVDTIKSGDTVLQNCVANVTSTASSNGAFSNSSFCQGLATCYTNNEGELLPTTAISAAEVVSVLNANISSITEVDNDLLWQWEYDGGLQLSAPKTAEPTPTYTVVYEVNGGKIKSQSVERGKTTTSLSKTDENVTLDGYDFLGWDSDGDGVADIEEGATLTVSEDLTLVGVYEASAPLTYSVTYTCEGDACGSLPVDENEYLSGGTAVVIANVGDLYIEGYVFDGWDVDGDGIADYVGGETLTIVGDVTLVAVFRLLPVVDEHAVPAITSFDKGILTYQYDGELLLTETVMAVVYNSQNVAVVETVIEGGEGDFRDELLALGKGSYYVKIAVVDSVTHDAVSNYSNPSQLVEIYSITTQKAIGTILKCQSLAFGGEVVSVSAQAYTGYENLAISVNNEEIDGSFVMPNSDVTVKTGAVMVVDYYSKVNALIANLTEEFSVGNYEIIKEIEGILDLMIDEQRAEVDTTVLDEAKTTYDTAIVDAEEDYEEVSKINTIMSVINTVTLTSLAIGYALRGRLV